MKLSTAFLLLAPAAAFTPGANFHAHTSPLNMATEAATESKVRRFLALRHYICIFCYLEMDITTSLTNKLNNATFIYPTFNSDLLTFYKPPKFTFNVTHVRC